jgi:hypothetical protein
LRLASRVSRLASYLSGAASAVWEPPSRSVLGFVAALRRRARSSIPLASLAFRAVRLRPWFVVAFAAAVALAGVGGLALADQRTLDGQIVVKTNGAIYLVQNGMRYLVQPVPLTDAEIDAIPDGGVVAALSGTTPDPAFDPAFREPAAAAETLFGRYWAFGQWDRAYAVLHPDLQAVVPRNFFIDTMRAFSTGFTITGAAPGEVELLDSWTEPVTGNTYRGVAHIPVALTLMRGGQAGSGSYDLYMAKVGDYWRWFWAPPGA